MRVADEEFSMCERSFLVERRASPPGHPNAGPFDFAQGRFARRRLSTALVVRGFRSLLFRSHFIPRMWYPHQPLTEPPNDFVEPLYPMPRLTRARQFMRLARKNYHGGRTLQKLERAEELLPA